MPHLLPPFLDNSQFLCGKMDIEKEVLPSNFEEPYLVDTEEDRVEQHMAEEHIAEERVAEAHIAEERTAEGRIAGDAAEDFDKDNWQEPEHIADDILAVAEGEEELAGSFQARVHFQPANWTFYNQEIMIIC